MHTNARTTPLSRAMIVQRVERDGLSCRAVATALQLSEKTVRKWMRRHRQEGLRGLADRSSRPHSVRPVEKRPGWRLVSVRAEAFDSTGDKVIEFESAVLVKAG